MKKNKSFEHARNRQFASIGLMTIALFLFLVFAFRFYQIMIVGQVKGVDIKQNLETRYSQEEALPAKRGTIYDASGSILAVDATNYSLYAVLTDKWSSSGQDHVMDASATAKALAQYIDLSEETIYSILTQTGRDQVEFGPAGKNLSVEVKESIEALQLPGIKLSEAPSRYYPNGIFASHLIGYTDLDADGKQLVGQMGVEALYNTELTGEPGLVQNQKDGEGYVIPNSTRVVAQPKDGKNLYLTLDKRLQTYMESLVSQVDETYQPKTLTAMLVDPATGNILAATQRPSFNGTTKEGLTNQWNNLLVDQEYEPGSTMKVLALAAAINEGVFDPNERYQSGSIKIYSDLVSDYNKVGWGNITYLEGLAHSSNVAFVHVVQKIGVEKWKQYLDAFGFGQSTGSGFANEVSGTNPYNSYLQQLSTGFGQGIAVTPFQMMQAFTAIANGGTMKQLRLVDSIEDPESLDKTSLPQTDLRQIISPEAAAKTLDYLYQATNMSGGTAGVFQIDGEKVAAKTGTAEMVNPETGKYYKSGSNFVYSVVGFAPYDKPEFILYITLSQPAYNPYGSGGTQIAADIFKPLMKRALEYNRLNQ